MDEKAPESSAGLSAQFYVEDDTEATASALIDQAYRDQATDVHLNSGRESIAVRLRIDGRL